MLYAVVTNFGKFLEFLSVLGAVIIVRIFSQIWQYSKYESRKNFEHPFMLYIVVTIFCKLLEFLSFLGHFYKKEFLIEHSFFKMQRICHKKNKIITTSPF
jgi:hypothetical protein